MNARNPLAYIGFDFPDRIEMIQPTKPVEEKHFAVRLGEPQSPKFLMASMEYFQLTEQNDLPGIGHFAPFKVVLAIEDVVGRSRQNEVSNWLVEMGGKCVMICGDHCKSWEQSIRQANLDQVGVENMEPHEFVMITTHERERLRNVFWHAKKHARHTHVKIYNILTIHIGSQNRSVEYLSMFEKA